MLEAFNRSKVMVGDIVKKVVIVGAGFTGLAAALELSKQGFKTVVVESDDVVGGLAGSFRVGGQYDLEKFYHHWFTNDQHVVDLVEELGETGKIVTRESRTGLYYNSSIFRLSKPIDVLRFTPLSLINRIRLGLLVFQVRGVKNWRSIEHLNVREWLVGLCGEEVYRVVWEPLIRGKFSVYADELSATWFWKKLQLRGSSRKSSGGEALAYYQGGFAALAERMSEQIRQYGGEVRLNERVSRIVLENGSAVAVDTDQGQIDADAVLATPAFPIIADILEGSTDEAYLKSLRRVNYLGNKCLILELSRSLSETYWLNVNDPSFPFVGIIEHTNFEPPSSYGGRHIVYMSKYLPHTDPVYGMDADELFDYAEPHIKRMFPNFDRSWVLGKHAWGARYAQPVTERHYSEYVPGSATPLSNVWISTMAHIYPEDRGTNYAIREGRKAAALVAEGLSRAPAPAPERSKALV